MALLLLLCTLVLLGAWSIWQAYRLSVSKNYKALVRYKGALPHQLPALAKHHARLLSAFGAWLMLIPILVIAWRIPFSSWSALILVGTAGFFLGQRFIERKHGLRHS